jgi:hypothetical protein
MGDHLRALRLRKEGYDWAGVALKMKIPAHILKAALEVPARQRIRKKVFRETSTQPPTGSD